MLNDLLLVLGSKRINLSTLKDICFNGIQDDSNLRGICWRVLLNYLPLDKQEWDNFLQQQRRLYESLVEEIMLKRGNIENGGGPVDLDHPLKSCSSSRWTKFFEDNAVVSQINKDVRRLCPEIGFFQKATEFPSPLLSAPNFEPLSRRVNSVLLDSETLIKNRSGATNLVLCKKVAAEQYNALGEGQEAHWQVVERILFVYAKMNPGIKYIQGMNEILGPIYYVFASDSNVEWRQHAEADAFFCFQNLMTEIRDNFIRTMDDSAHGIEHRMKVLYDMLKSSDPQLFDHLTLTQQLLPQYFAFRWISLLLSQEFLLPEVIRIWDSVFSAEDKFQFLLHFCLSMIAAIRNQLLENDFSTNVRMLQNYPNGDVFHLISAARQSIINAQKLQLP